MKRLFAVIAMALFITTGCSIKEDECSSESESITPSVKAFDELSEEKELILKSNTPIYYIDMVEKPEVSMWEFTYGVNLHENINIATLVSEDSKIVYDVFMYREESYLRPGYRYYIGVQKNSYCNTEPSFSFQVYEGTIDEAWLMFEASLKMYNCLNERVRCGELMTSNIAGNVYEYLEKSMSEYKESGFVDTEMVVAAALDEEDWLYNFYISRVGP